MVVTEWVGGGLHVQKFLEFYHDLYCNPQDVGESSLSTIS